MPPMPKYTEIDYISFLMGAQCELSCVRGADCFPTDSFNIAHDAINRFLLRESLSTEALWNEVKPFVELKSGWLVADDTVIDKIHSKKIEGTYFQWSGKHRKVVRGIGLISLVWTDGEHTFPINYRIYDIDNDEKTKNDHFQDMLQEAYNKGFRPYFVLFDSWYSGVANLKFIRNLGLNWFSRLKKNRSVSPEKDNKTDLQSMDLHLGDQDGREVHLKAYGFVKIFVSLNKAGNRCYWATNCLTMDNYGQQNLEDICWNIENYHRVIKEVCNVEKCKLRKGIGQRNHINCSLRAYVRFEVNFLKNGQTPYDANWEIVKPAITAFMKNHARKFF